MIVNLGAMKNTATVLWLGLVFFTVGAAGADRYREWKEYGGGPESIRYSSLDQVNRRNVHAIEVAWTYDTGDAFEGSEMQCNPIVAGGLLYATTPKLRVIALDAATGKLRWSFAPNEGRPAI